MVLDQPEELLEAVGEALVDHRPVQDVLERVADHGLLGGAREAGQEVVVHRLVHDGRAHRRAALAGGAEAAEQRPLHRQVQVGVGHDHQRVLAAQLQARRLQVAPAQLADACTHRARAGEADLVHQVAVQRGLQAGEGGVAVGQHHLQHAVRQAAGLQQAGQRPADLGRVLGRLPHHRVAAQQRRDDVPGRHRRREVPGGDDGRHAHRVAEREQLLVGHLRRHRLAVQAPALTQEEVTGVDDLLHLAARLGDRLAHLGGHHPRQRLLVGLHDAADLLDRAAAAGRRRGGPFALRGPGALTGGNEVLAGLRHGANATGAGTTAATCWAAAASRRAPPPATAPGTPVAGAARPPGPRPARPSRIRSRTRRPAAASRV